MNSVIVTGRLTSDPELRFTAGGKAVATFSVAVNHRGSDEADFFDCVAWEKLGEVVADHLAKGRRVLVNGYLKQSRWTTPEGDNRQKVQVVATQVEFLDRRPNANGDEPAGLGESDEQS
jgi:single-strand DNA-binding protein